MEKNSTKFFFKKQARGPIRCVKKIRGKRGKPDTIEYLVNIDVVNINS